jgi:GNAT superfamily N-acetyltransferase
VSIAAAVNPRDVREFCSWSARLYEDDPHYVQPLITAWMDKLSPEKDPFWKHASRALFVAKRGGRTVGSIAAVHDRSRGAIGHFAYFECIDDSTVAKALIDAAKHWLKLRGCSSLEGPYNLSASDEHGVLVDGYNTRPAVMEGHHRQYYTKLLESAGLVGLREAYAWLVTTPEGNRDLTSIFPDKLTKGAARARKNPAVSVRSLDLTQWHDEVTLTHGLYNRAMATVPEFVPMDEGSFRTLCESFKPIVDSELIKIVAVEGKAVGFAIALPDANEALQCARGELSWRTAARVWLRSRKLKRAVFKVLVIDPDYRQRGLESLLIEEVAKAILQRGFTEADLSLTGEENVKINMILAGLGFTVYRRYRVYRCDL